MTDAYKLIAVLAGLVTIFGAIWGVFKFVIDPFRRKHYQPKLKLIDRFYLGEQGVASAGTIRLFLQNTGKATAKDILVKLKVFRPRDARPGYKLFFNEDIGSLESYQEPSWLDTDRGQKPEVYEYRLKPESFVNPGFDAALEIVRFIVFAVEKTLPADIDHEVEWIVQCAGQTPATGKITRKGSDLKRELLKNLYESGRVVGYEKPSGKLPESFQDGSG